MGVSKNSSNNKNDNVINKRNKKKVTTPTWDAERRDDSFNNYEAETAKTTDISSKNRIYSRKNNTKTMRNKYNRIHATIKVEDVLSDDEDYDEFKYAKSLRPSPGNWMEPNDL